MSEMIERAAKAIYSTECNPATWPMISANELET